MAFFKGFKNLFNKISKPGIEELSFETPIISSTLSNAERSNFGTLRASRIVNGEDAFSQKLRLDNEQTRFLGNSNFGTLKASAFYNDEDAIAQRIRLDRGEPFHTSNNSGFGYLDNVGAKEEVGTFDKFSGTGVNTPSRTIANPIVSSNNDAWGYLDAIEAKEEVGTLDKFNGAGLRIPSKTVGLSGDALRQKYASPDNSFFGYLDTVGTGEEVGTREQFARSHFHGRSETVGPSVYDKIQENASTDNSFFGYLDTVGATTEEGTTEKFLGNGVHSKSRLVDNPEHSPKGTPKSETTTDSGSGETPISESGASSGATGQTTDSSQATVESGQSDGPSGGSTESSAKQSGPIFVSKDDPRVGTTDANGILYMPDDISGGGFTASAKQHAYQKAYEKASNVDKWQQSELDKIDNLKKPENMKAEDWEKQQQQRRDVVNKQAGQIINNWETMRGDSAKISPGVSDYVLGNPHAVATVGGVGTLGFLALQLSDSRGQMTNRQLYGQDDLT